MSFLCGSDGGGQNRQAENRQSTLSLRHDCPRLSHLYTRDSQTLLRVCRTNMLGVFVRSAVSLTAFHFIYVYISLFACYFQVRNNKNALNAAFGCAAWSSWRGWSAARHGTAQDGTGRQQCHQIMFDYSSYKDCKVSTCVVCCLHMHGVNPGSFHCDISLARSTSVLRMLQIKRTPLD